ncbi:MAG: RlmE family RNA methyltransferase [Deltaproteobacteria bacterium]|nr:RlmE family RNA methyltransferase [Deltaproteobacteria bacterium]
MPRRDNPYRHADHHSREARAQGYPARSVFKLEEIDRRARLLRPGQRVLDLGAAPGSWSLFAAQRIGPSGRLFAVDLQPLAQTLGPGCTFIQGDALSLQNDQLALYAPYDVVLSDMAPSTTGNRESDAARSEELFLRAVDVAVHLGHPGSSFVGKLFMGGGFEEVRARLRQAYQEVRLMRPDATRKQSVEIFLIGIGKRTATAGP